VATHAVGNHRQRHPTLVNMWKDRETVLLFLAISLVLRGARIN